MRGDGTIAQHEHDEHESGRYQRGTDPVHAFVFLPGRLVGVNGEDASDGDQSRDSCRNVEDGSPSLAVQTRPSTIFISIQINQSRTHAVSSTTTAPIVDPNTDPAFPT